MLVLCRENDLADDDTGAEEIVPSGASRVRSASSDSGMSRSLLNTDERDIPGRRGVSWSVDEGEP